MTAVAKRPKASVGLNIINEGGFCLYYRQVSKGAKKTSGQAWVVVILKIQTKPEDGTKVLRGKVK